MCFLCGCCVHWHLWCVCILCACAYSISKFGCACGKLKREKKAREGQRERGKVEQGRADKAWGQARVAFVAIPPSSNAFVAAIDRADQGGRLHSLQHLLPQSPRKRGRGTRLPPPPSLSLSASIFTPLLFSSPLPLPLPMVASCDCMADSKERRHGRQLRVGSTGSGRKLAVDTRRHCIRVSEAFYKCVTGFLFYKSVTNP